MALLLLASCGCTSLPRGRAAVTSVDVNGNAEVSSKSIKKKLATRSSPKFLGLFRGVVYEYEVFDLFVLQRDLARIERYYHARGFYKARARAGRVFYDGPSRASVLIEIEEGPPTLIGKLELGGLEGVDPDAARAARDAAKERVGVGKRFEEGAYEEAEKQIRRALTDAGYAYARVTRRAEVDLPTNRARLRNKTALLAELAPLLLQQRRASWLERFARAGVPCAPVHTVPEALDHPQVQALEMLQPLADAGFALTALPLSVDGERAVWNAAAPTLGQHNAAHGLKEQNP